MDFLLAANSETMVAREQVLREEEIVIEDSLLIKDSFKPEEGKTHKSGQFRKKLGSIALTIGIGMGTTVAGEVINPAVAEAANCGDVILSGDDWLAGTGVDIRSNSPYQGNGTSCKEGGAIFDLQANPPQMGEGWQCVEAVNRLYATKGWFSNLSPVGSAKNIYTKAANGDYKGLAAKANGSGYKPILGDMLVESSGDHGHVAIVNDIVGNTLYTVEQNSSANGKNSYAYNPENGSVSKLGKTIPGYVHAEKNTGEIINPSLEPSKPAVISRTSDSLDVFVRNGNGNLENRWWTAASGWHTKEFTNIDDKMFNNPAAIARSPGNTDVFFRNTKNELMHRFWDANTGWHSEIVKIPNDPKYNDIASSPTVIARDSSTMDVFYTNYGGDLINMGWNVASGWNKQTLAMGEAAGSPVAISRNATSMDVFFQGTNGRLVNAYWSPGLGWNKQTLAHGMKDNPTVVARSVDSMDVFYAEDDGELANRYWDPVNSWRYQTWREWDRDNEQEKIVSTPSVISRSDGSMDVFFRDSNNKLVNFFWDSTNNWRYQSWPNNITGNPTAVTRSPGSIDVFYRNYAGELGNDWWNASYGWHQGSQGGSVGQ